MTRSADKTRVLVVADDAAAESFDFLLRLWGYAVQVCPTAGEALEAAGDQPPQVVLLDFDVPEEGYPAARRFHELGAVVIALVDAGQALDRRCARRAGIHHHLTTPVDSYELQKLLREAEGAG
jgi:two-component system OmpR family response regulator